jgi:hypothetical protein
MTTRPGTGKNGNGGGGGKPGSLGSANTRGGCGKPTEKLKLTPPACALEALNAARAIAARIRIFFIWRIDGVIRCFFKIYSFT